MNGHPPGLLILAGAVLLISCAAAWPEGSVRLGTASLGAVSGHLAARVDEVSRRNPRDGSSE